MPGGSPERGAAAMQAGAVGAGGSAVGPRAHCTEAPSTCGVESSSQNVRTQRQGTPAVPQSQAGTPAPELLRGLRSFNFQGVFIFFLASPYSRMFVCDQNSLLPHRWEVLPSVPFFCCKACLTTRPTCGFCHPKQTRRAPLLC